MSCSSCSNIESRVLKALEEAGGGGRVSRWGLEALVARIQEVFRLAYNRSPRRHLRSFRSSVGVSSQVRKGCGECRISGDTRPCHA